MMMSTQAPPIQLGVKSVLVASDFSEASAKALWHAVTIARHFHANFYLTHVVSSLGYTIAGADVEAAAATAAQREVEQLEKSLVESGAITALAHEFLVREGNVWEELRAVICEKKVDLVVVGTHGRHGIEKLVLGSVAEQVFREADGLVLTVGPQAQPDAPIERSDGMRPFLFPTDFGEASLHALPYAVSFANHFGAKLVLLHVLPVMPIPETFSWSRTPSDTTQMRKDARQEALQRLHEFVLGSAPLLVSPEFRVEFGKHGESILHVARSLTADLIIMGLNHSNHGRALSHLPETTAYKIVVGAHCSVLTVRN
jgi:nucleotide-binding universal stress UspA family protein